MGKRLLGLFIGCLLCVMPVLGQEDAAYQWALERIDASETYKAIDLDFSNMDLKALPPQIGQLTHLRHLDLSGTQITTLPPEIGNLIHLESLDLSNTPLTSLPPEIGRLSSLKTLYLNGTNLTTLPPELGKLRELNYLSVHDTKIAFPPSEIMGQGTSSALQYLRDHDTALVSQTQQYFMGLGLFTGAAVIGILAIYWQHQGGRKGKKKPF